MPWMPGIEPKGACEALIVFLPFLCNLWIFALYGLMKTIFTRLQFIKTDLCNSAHVRKMRISFGAFIVKLKSRDANFCVIAIARVNLIKWLRR